ncbi:hypothetical protein JAAARDRAFT_60977 [Jaapia argillacea MUCL 33604]|uniref:Uncharacterized protein n=1 Tax=Jaapia argillacea MUCL 33604 TaxID=933084 RepID=A0A067PU67_9AGAM|nr:hypothetical protein JAAARDRAFT_60977 [Jaapia argillacea MUCL 33604]
MSLLLSFPAPFDDLEMITRSRLLHGILLQQTHVLTFSPRHTAQLSENDAPTVTLLQEEDIYDDSVDTSFHNSLLTRGFVNAAATACLPYLMSLGLGWSRGWYDGTSVAASSHFATARCVYRRVEVQVNKGILQPDPDFVKDINHALLHSDSGEPPSRAERLREVLREWGQIVPTDVVLGCSLTTSAHLASTDHSHTSESINRFEAGFGFALAQVGASTDFTYTTSSGAGGSYQAKEKSIRVHVVARHHSRQVAPVRSSNPSRAVGLRTSVPIRRAGGMRLLMNLAHGVLLRLRTSCPVWTC